MNQTAKPAPAVVRFENVDIVFGKNPKSALPLIDAGKTRDEIQAETGQVLGVCGATLDIHEGEIVVLMGLSGSGKSTLLRAINGLNPVIRGRALVQSGEDQKSDFIDPASCSRKQLRYLRQNRVAMVFQQFGLLPWRTVADNVGFGLEIAGVAKPERDRRVAEQLALVGLENWSDRQVGELSGGMQQRVGLARAFATNAPILLMDEPFSALDPLIRDKLQDDLLELQAQLKRTIIFVSHDLDEALKLGNRIAIMEGGHVVQVGTPQEIILNPSSDYVAEFVAHMNPLAILRAEDVMRKEALPRGADSIRQGDAPFKKGTFALLPVDAPVKQVRQAQLATELPVLVEDHGQTIGVIDTHDVVQALVQRSTDPTVT